MKRLLLLTLLLVIASLLPAHEFWIQPDKYIYKLGEPINLRLNVGENFLGNNWSGTREKINLMQLIYEDITDDLSNHLSDTAKGDSLQFSIAEEGTAMVIFNNHNSFIELEAQKFNAYLAEDKLQSAIDYRTSHQEMDSVGREYYQRSAKSLIQIGEKLTRTFKKETALPIDIIPEENPYSLNDGERLKLKVLFLGKPLVRQWMNIWHRHNQQLVKTFFTTDEKGEFEVPVFRTGSWMVSTVHMLRLESDSKADWQSYWGSLTWGYVR